MPEIVAHLDKVSYIYPRSELPALRDISLELRKGEFFGLIGPTGAGKTTLCLALNGIVPQFYGGRFFGRALVAGLDTVEHPISTLARHVGMVFEDPETQLTAISVEHEVAFALENLCVPREEIRARILRALAAVRLEGMEKKHPHELSGGQKQRLAIASALAVQPELLVLDEPTSQLDPLGTREIFALLRDLNRELGITIMMTSHASEEMAEYADRVALLAEGEVVALDMPGQLYGQVDLLQRYGIRPPQVALTFSLLNGRDPRADPIPVTLEQGLARVRALPACAAAPGAEAPELPCARTGQPFFSTRHLTHRYADGTEALSDVTLDIHTGEYVLIAGHNGAGKSTLVKHFLNLLHPTSGEVQVGGSSVEHLPVSGLAQRIGYVAQNPDDQIFTSTVWDEAAFALRTLGYPPAEIEARVTACLSALNLLEKRCAHPLSLPKGERVRLIVAAVLALKPEALIFDEPTTAQDYRGAQAILDLSKALHAEGKTVIVITHQLYLMPSYAERMIVMGQGRVLLDAPLRQAYQASEALRFASLLPPQAVSLAQAACPGRGLITPEEVAGCLGGRVGAMAS